jgi:hypothetical protein
MPEWTARDKLKEVERELKYRRFVYPKAIERNQMTVKASNRQMHIMEAIADDYRERIARDEDLLRLAREEQSP